MKRLLGQNRVTRVACLLGVLAAGHGLGTDSDTPAATTAATAVSHNSSYIEPNGTAHVGADCAGAAVAQPAGAGDAAACGDGCGHSGAARKTARHDGRVYGARREAVAEDLSGDGCQRYDGGRSGAAHHAAACAAANAGKVLLDLHGGGFDSDSGSYTETIPIAYYARVPVVAALYRLAPEHPFPAAVDDAVAVYRELLKTHKPEQIAIYGTSAGAILTGEVAVQLKQLSLPEPAALGIFSGLGDFARDGRFGAPVRAARVQRLSGDAGHR